MASLSINPILTRELRARWRGGRSMFLVFGYVSLLAVAAGLVYSTSSISNDASSIRRDMAELGHNLFLVLSGLQIAAWMLIAPALTATSIAGEREHGLLELLQLTPLSGWRICNGKIGSALLLVVLLMFAPLPVTALCFLLGGVSPAEFCVALALQVATVLLGLSLGLWMSARSRRAIGAITSTFVAVITGFIVSFLLFLAHAGRLAWCYAAPGSTNMELLRAAPLDLAWRANPLLVFLNAVQSPATPTSASWLNTYVGLDVDDWIINVALQCSIAFALWVFAARVLGKPFADAAEETVSTSKRGSFLRRTDAPNSAAAEDIEYSKRRFPAVLNSSVLSNAQSDSLWWQWNWVARFRSPNPMLEREVRRRARWRRISQRARFKTRFVAAVTFLICGWAIWQWLQNSLQNLSDAWMIVSVITFIVLLFFSCVQGALAFAREHEAGTWEGIRLSLLSPSQILWGKLLPPFGIALLIGAALWTPTILCIDGIFGEISHSNSRVTLDKFVGTLFIAAAFSWVVLCWGAWVSSQFKRVWPAIVWTIASLLFAYIALPVLLVIVVDTMHVYSYGRDLTDFLRLWHPMLAVSELWAPSHSYSPDDIQPSAWNVVFQFVVTVCCISAILLAFTHRQLQRLVGVKTSVENAGGSSVGGSSKKVSVS